MRLFVAVNPPVEALQELSDAAAPLHGLSGADRLRWSDPDGWHLTLAFLGEVPAADVPALEERLGRVAGEHGVHRLRLAGAGCFGDRVLWVGFDGETWALRRLAEGVRTVVEEAGIESDQHGFHPHLTLARAGSTHGQRRATRRLAAGELQLMAAALEGWRGSEWEASELHLMRSELGYGPARYTSVRAWPLARWEA
ncbi:RNA 2',3'-cyclic phosphodiesterase [Kitasatospora cinereorecta]|uniref:RNA 2',3'-cyclic phosphodiesterase n=1 Tax=Kitasatospora cinereorecta TaxID=285560 RepID=A0ABW0V821_9ACTN